MPKLIEYPRTTYTGAWELSEIVDDTGGKCAVETAARKLNRKVSGSFKAIIGSAVKFGLMTSKRELLTTTTLFKRIKHAYDKAEELQFHREAFLTPPLFTQICRKFRSRELPVQMLDVMLIREFGVEEINAQNVAKAFVDGCRMCGLIDEQNIIADIDAINNRAPRRALSNVSSDLRTFTSPLERPVSAVPTEIRESVERGSEQDKSVSVGLFGQSDERFINAPKKNEEKSSGSKDAIADLFGLDETTVETGGTIDVVDVKTDITVGKNLSTDTSPGVKQATPELTIQPAYKPESVLESSQRTNPIYQMQMNGPGVNTALDITEEADIALAIALLEKIRRQLRASA